MSSLVVIAAFLFINAKANGSPTNVTTDTEPIILGGACAKEGQFPYQIQLFATPGACGGSIISKSYILTAKHCVEGADIDKIFIYAGSNLSKEGGVVRKASVVKMHPSENQDIALVRLNKDLKFNSKIQPIKMSAEEVPENATITIAGWGLTRNKGRLSHCLKFNIAKALSSKSCVEEYPSYKDFLCLRHPINNGACNGDSGGPAIYKKKLVGVANVVMDGCGSTNADGYAQIRANIMWIQQNSK